MMKALSPVAAKTGKTAHGVRHSVGKTGEPQTSLPPRAEAQAFVPPGSGLLPHSIAHIPAAPMHLPLQRKLAIGETNDPLEAEADRMADHVLRMKDPALPATGASAGPVLQRKCACEGTGTSCNECEDAERGKKLHRKTQSTAGITEAPPVVHDVLHSPGQPLDSAARAWFEPRFDHDFRSVRVHADACAADSARSVNALAYTVGNHIVFAGGRFNPACQEGRRLLAHELTHVMQQQGHKGSLVQRQAGEMKPVQVGSPDPEECENRADITKEFNDFIKALPALLQSAPDFTPEQKVSFKGEFDRFLQVEGGINIKTFKVISCDKINSDLLIGGETARAEVKPDKKEILLSKSTKQLIDDFKQNKDKESLGQLIETLAHEKRHVTLGSALKVDPQALRPGRPETVAQRAEYRAQEILAVAEEIAVGRMAFGKPYAVPESKQQKLRRQNNIMRGYVTEAEYKRLRALIIAKLRQRYGFEHNCDNALTVGVVSSMDHNRWFECVSGAPGGIVPPVAADLHVCDDFCRTQTRAPGPTENEEGVDLQRKAEGAAPAEAPPIVHEVLHSPGQPLDPATRAFFEPRFGHDFSRVRVHTDDVAARSARAVGALAYAVGEHIVFRAGLTPNATEARPLLAHELTHVVQRSHSIAPALMRAHDPHQPGSSRSVPLSDLHDILVKLLKSLKRRTQLSVMGFKTIAIALVETTDDNDVVFQTLVYTTSGNWGSTDVQEQAAALGIERWNPNPRTEGRGDVGAPADAEQLLIEAAGENDFKVLGMAVSRKPCPDCSVAVADEDVATVFVDPAKHLPRRQRVRKRKPSAAMEAARSEILQAFLPQVVTPGQEATSNLGPKSSLWLALNVLDMPELYQVLEEADRAGRLTEIQRRAGKAEGVDNNRLIAPMDAIQLKKENLREKPEELRQFLSASVLMERLHVLPSDQRNFILHQLYPDLRLQAPPRPAPPQKTDQQPSKPKEKVKSPTDTAKDSSSFVEPMIKALAAVGLTAAAIDALADTLVAIASKVFVDVVLRIVVEGAGKVPVRDVVKKIADEALKDAGPKARVLTETARHRVADKIGEEVGHLVEEMTKSYAHH